MQKKPATAECRWCGGEYSTRGIVSHINYCRKNPSRLPTAEDLNPQGPQETDSTDGEDGREEVPNADEVAQVREELDRTKKALAELMETMQEMATTIKELTKEKPEPAATPTPQEARGKLTIEIGGECQGGHLLRPDDVHRSFCPECSTQVTWWPASKVMTVETDRVAKFKEDARPKAQVDNNSHEEKVEKVDDEEETTTNQEQEKVGETPKKVEEKPKPPRARIILESDDEEKGKCLYHGDDCWLDEEQGADFKEEFKLERRMLDVFENDAYQEHNAKEVEELNEEDLRELKMTVREAIGEVATETARREATLTNHSADEFRKLGNEMSGMRRSVDAQNARVAQYGHKIDGLTARFVGKASPESPIPPEAPPGASKEEAPPEEEGPEPEPTTFIGQCTAGGDKTHYFEKGEESVKFCPEDGTRIKRYDTPKVLKKPTVPTTFIGQCTADGNNRHFFEPGEENLKSCPEDSKSIEWYPKPKVLKKKSKK